MATPQTKGPAGPAEVHAAARARFDAEVATLERRANRVSLVRLLLFAGGAVLVTAGVAQPSLPLLGAGAALLVAFGAAVVWHARVLAARDLAGVRRDVHTRHLQRLSGAWVSLPHTGEGLVELDHPYAHDIDLVGPGSLFQRIDTTHTVRGERTLAAWLAAPADLATIAGRQEAVAELSGRVELRQELEASAALAAGATKLDAEPFLAFTRRGPYFASRTYLVPLIHVLPAATLAAGVAWQQGVLPPFPLFGLLVVQLLVSLATARGAHAAFDLIAARRGFAEAFARMLGVVESARFESPALRALAARLVAQGVPASKQLRLLDRWAGLADFRTQAIVHLFVNPLVLWDLHVLLRLEAWNRTAGAHAKELFDALGELEALASFAALHHGDPAATFPEVRAQVGYAAEGLAHPLLEPASRVANDLEVPGPGRVLLVTGSNMAGKSTLLRAVGVSIALALAGGPVTAKRLSLSRVRLRASMRARDDLQRGASYFHAELTKLRSVVAEADAEPPIFFLLDELLRGTNAHARHLGARGVLLHLLDRGALGLVATHDVALADLEQERPEVASNAHFTDVVEGGEMTFDYRLRPGVVRTSNALRLLRMAGIDVPDDDAVRD